MKSILIVDDEISVCTLLKRFLTKNGFIAESLSSGEQAIKYLKEHQIDLVLCDYHLQDYNGKDFLFKIKQTSPTTIIIFITGYADVRNAVELIKNGAYHYLSKPLYPDDILKIIQEAFIAPKQSHHIPAPELEKQKNLIKEENNLKPFISTYPDKYIYGNGNGKVAEMYANIDLIASTNYTVIIHGETGTGKEALARLIHHKSSRSDKPFIPIDCGSLSKELANSELFGHEKGAFTGALSTKIGAFEEANGGTIFLDEIGNLSSEVQVYLLRAIQQKQLRRVGSAKTIPLDIRIIVATNVDLAKLVASKCFREDVFYRLNEFEINVPSLRERQEDIENFIHEFTENACKDIGIPKLQIPKQFVKDLENYYWPGNIRQLRNVIRICCLKSKQFKEIQTASLLEEMMTQNFDSVQQDKDDKSLKDISSEAEIEKILEVLKMVNYNKTKAAQILNIDRKTLYNKLKQVEIK